MLAPSFSQPNLWSMPYTQFLWNFSFASWHLDPWRNFPECPFPAHVSLLWTLPCLLRLELVFFRNSFLLCNVAFFYSFSNFQNIEKDKKKIKYLPKGGRKKYFLYGSTMSHPWTNHILPLFHQDLGFYMTLGSCSHYRELCPPLFGYSSKHMESLCCLLHRELMSMTCCMSLIISRAIVQGNFYPTWVDLSAVCLLTSCSTIPKVQSSPCSKSMKLFAWSSISSCLFPDESSKTSG